MHTSTITPVHSEEDRLAPSTSIQRRSFENTVEIVVWEDNTRLGLKVTAAICEATAALWDSRRRKMLDIWNKSAAHEPGEARA